MEEVIVSLNQHSIMEPKVRIVYSVKSLANLYDVSLIELVHRTFVVLFSFSPGDRFHGIYTAEEQHRVDKQAVLQEKQVLS